MMSESMFRRWHSFLHPDEPGMWRFRGLIPGEPSIEAVSLGEGDSALLRASRLGSADAAPSVYLKMESSNPTSSHKDRLASLGVSVAVAEGAQAVIVGSSGNQGAAAAAYCAAVGIPCIVVTTAEIPALMRIMIQSYGAMLAVVPTASDRGRLIGAALQTRPWFALSGYADPPVGSHPSAIPAYATIAYELFEQTDGVLPDSIVVPTSHGDTLAGMWAGLCKLRDLFDLETLPRLIAVEPFGSLERTLRSGSSVPELGSEGTTRAFSIAGRRSTPQALAAVRDSGGTAVQVDDGAMREAHIALARQGLFVEPSSAMAVGALGTLSERGAIRPDERTVVLITSSGMKDPDYAAESLGDVPVIDPQLADLDAALRSRYDVHPPN